MMEYIGEPVNPQKRTVLHVAAVTRLWSICFQCELSELNAPWQCVRSAGEARNTERQVFQGRSETVAKTNFASDDFGLERRLSFCQHL